MLWQYLIYLLQINTLYLLQPSTLHLLQSHTSVLHHRIIAVSADADMVSERKPATLGDQRCKSSVPVVLLRLLRFSTSCIMMSPRAFESGYSCRSYDDAVLQRSWFAIQLSQWGSMGLWRGIPIFTVPSWFTRMLEQVMSPCTSSLYITERQIRWVWVIRPE